MVYWHVKIGCCTITITHHKWILPIKFKHVLNPMDDLFYKDQTRDIYEKGNLINACLGQYIY